jgi:hypothetical protein
MVVFRLGKVGLVAFSMLGTVALVPALGQQPSTVILRFVEGADAAPKPMADAEVKALLNDPWAVHILRKGVFPDDLTKALGALTATGTFPDTEQESFFVSESGQIHDSASTKGLQRDFRMVITRGGPADQLPPVLISAPAGDRAGFIELMSWDDTKKAFNFYRRPKNGQWTWKGDTRDAFRVATQGKGCFQYHSNGVPVMKELRIPWNNWNSSLATIPPEAVPDEDIRKGSLFLKRADAYQLEPMIRGWIDRATQARIADIMKGDSIADAPRLLRPLFTSTTVNLTTSLMTSQGNTVNLNLPPGLFLNFDLFSDLSIAAPPGFSTRVRRPQYQDTLTTFAFQLQQGKLSIKGDTHFAFMTPEQASEDIVSIRQLIAQKVITRHFAACVLLVDFPNPIFSSARESLLKYVPVTGNLQDGRSDLPERTALAIIQAAASIGPDTPERRFAEWWNMTPDQLQRQATARIQTYLTAVQARLKTQTGVNDYTRLAESRRQRFAKLVLNEFELLLPHTNIPAAERRMNPDGTISP